MSAVGPGHCSAVQAASTFGRMAYVITHLSGAQKGLDSPMAFGQLLDELDDASAEQPDVAVSDESGWSLSALASGDVILGTSRGGRRAEERRQGCA